MSIDALAAQLKDIFNDRLRMVAAFGDNANTCAVVQTLTIEDLDRCAAHADAVEQGRPRCAAVDRRGRAAARARCVPARAQRNHRHPPRRCGSRPVRRHRGAEAGPAARVRGAGARSCAASPRGLYRSGRRQQEGRSARVGRDSAVSRAREERRAAGRHLAEGAGDAVGPRQFRKRISRRASRGRTDCRIRGHGGTIDGPGIGGLGIVGIACSDACACRADRARPRRTHCTHRTCLRAATTTRADQTGQRFRERHRCGERSRD